MCLCVFSPQGHTTGDKDIHQNLRVEITKNFDPRRRLRGAAIAVQTVNYLSKETQLNSKKCSLQRENQQLDTKKVVFSDEVLNLSAENIASHNLQHGSDSKLNFSENLRRNLENLLVGDLPLRHVSSPEINAPTGQQHLSELVLNAVSEESVLPYQHGFSRSDVKRKPILRKTYGGSLQENIPQIDNIDTGRKRKRSLGARVESKDGTPINSFHVPEITENDEVNLQQFVERDVVLKPVLIDEDNSHAHAGQTTGLACQHASLKKTSCSHSDITEELRRIKMSFKEGENVAVEV